MIPVQFKLNKDGEGLFYLAKDGELIGEMVVNVSGNLMTVIHTEVDPKMQGQRLAKELFDRMVEYAREQHWKVRPLCPYVFAQFQKHPEDYADIWHKHFD